MSEAPQTRETWIRVCAARQELELRQGVRCLLRLPVSTARNGLGERNGSGRTPRGWHCIRARIGADCPPAAVFVGRRWTGEIWTPALQARQPERDWILSRILWLSGLEAGFNRLGDVDTMRRFIYFHGCPDTEPMGRPLSHGCIRLRNDAVITLHDRVPVGTRVWIGEGEPAS